MWILCLHFDKNCVFAIVALRRNSVEAPNRCPEWRPKAGAGLSGAHGERADRSREALPRAREAVHEHRPVRRWLYQMEHLDFRLWKIECFVFSWMCCNYILWFSFCASIFRQIRRLSQWCLWKFAISRRYENHHNSKCFVCIFERKH